MELRQTTFDTHYAVPGELIDVAVGVELVQGAAVTVKPDDHYDTRIMVE